MDQKEFYIYTAILLLLIFVLSIAVSFYYQKNKILQAAKDKYISEIKKRELERIEYISDSIITIARAFTQKQVEAAEACIRLRMLIDRTELLKNESYPNLFAMYEEIKGFRTHEARNILSLKDKHEEDRLRFRIEDQYHLAIEKECFQLIEDAKI